MLIPSVIQWHLTLDFCCLLNVMRETQEDYYLVLFTFASQLYFYVLGPISLLGY